VEDQPDPQPFKDQPRDISGRFNKKPNRILSPNQPRTRAERARDRDMVKTLHQPVKVEDHHGSSSVRSLKRKKVHPRPTLFRGASLFLRPSPLNFALKAWAPPFSTEALAPSSVISTVPEVIDITEEVVATTMTISTDSSTMRLPSFTMKPSPFSFARRRWSSVPSPSRSDETSGSDEVSHSSDEQRPLKKRKHKVMYRAGKYMSPFQFTHRCLLEPAFDDNNAEGEVSDEDAEGEPDFEVQPQPENEVSTVE
jgi:hypothetical protein